MSEIRLTRRIQVVESPSGKMLLSQLLAQANSSTAAITPSTSSLTSIGTSLSSNPAEPITLSRAEGIVQAAPNATAALRLLAAESGLEIAAAETERFLHAIQKLPTVGDGKVEVLTIARDIIRARQERLQTATVAITTEACKAIGFTPRSFSSSPGLITACGDGAKKITIDVEKTSDGDLRMHLDADGFRGGECTVALDALQEQIKSRGVHFRIDHRQRKDRGPVVDGKHLKNGRRTRNSSR